MAGGLVPLATTAAGGSEGQFALTQNVLPGLAHATDLGAAPAATPLHLVVSVARPNAAGEAATLAAVHNPASPSYRHFLTPAQFAAQFGVPAGRQDALRSLFAGSGLHVDSASVAE
jgi:subtilase family serine protease